MKRFAILIIVVSFILGGYFYGQFPDQVASHWNAEGEADGFTSKFWGLFLFPIIMVALYVLLELLPRLDPLKKNVKKEEYEKLLTVIIAFLCYIYILTILWNSGKRFSFVQLLVPAFGFLFYYLGSIIKNVKRNWMIGIRTPWTLSSDKVWQKTHEMAGKGFKIAGLTTFLGILFEEYALWFMIVPVVGVAIWAFAYSYVLFKNG